ncbi:hypothetical protein C1H46_031877 [Malus baccata]|uniref:Uncharacterized protein n=1 Tax=Malus baccata TaxID=106549 RepID=A0A540L7X7_MALBA|nr:hypothetical protein C1H46_031877 [Malus baccata]
MAENTEIVIKEDGPKGPKNLFSLFPKFKLQFPFLKQEPEGVIIADEPRKADEGTESNIQKPVVVSFPKAQVVAPPPVAVEYEEPITKTSNPIIFWQLSALGGYLVLRWIWARWQERRDKKDGSSDDERSSADE